jgi:hypothetical protein
LTVTLFEGSYFHLLDPFAHSCINFTFIGLLFALASQIPTDFVLTLEACFGGCAFASHSLRIHFVFASNCWLRFGFAYFAGFAGLAMASRWSHIRFTMASQILQASHGLRIGFAMAPH